MSGLIHLVYIDHWPKTNNAFNIYSSTSYYVQLFRTQRGSEYLPSTLPTFNGTLYWSVTRDTNVSAVLIKASNIIFYPTTREVTVAVLTVPLGCEHRRRCRSHDIYITVPSRSQRKSFSDQWSVERKQQHAHDPKRCRGCDLPHGFCPGLQLHRPCIQRQRPDCIYCVTSLHDILVIKLLSRQVFIRLNKIYMYTPSSTLVAMIIKRVSNCHSLCLCTE